MILGNFQFIFFFASRWLVLHVFVTYELLLRRESVAFVATYCYWIEGNKNGFSFLLGDEAIAKVTTVSWKRNQSSIWPDFTLQRLISTLIFGYFEATFCVITKKKLPTINRLFFGSKANFLHKGGSFFLLFFIFHNFTSSLFFIFLWIFYLVFTQLSTQFNNKKKEKIKGKIRTAEPLSNLPYLHWLPWGTHLPQHLLLCMIQPKNAAMKRPLNPNPLLSYRYRSIAVSMHLLVLRNK